MPPLSLVPHVLCPLDAVYGFTRRRCPEPDFPTQPPLLNFKQFLSQQDDAIGEEEAIRKYNEYKLGFRRQQISEFFVNHKEEEWSVWTWSGGVSRDQHVIWYARVHVYVYISVQVSVVGCILLGGTLLLV